jgi:23S rRNA pseudouridine1911/1915/1917 synthase
MQLPILFENADIVAINKPSGLVVHPDGRTEEPTVIDWILERYPESGGVGEPLVLSSGTVIDRPGIVHRLDRDTSGVLLVAKTQPTFLYLKEQFKKRTLRKKYLAFVFGYMREREGSIDRPIGRSRKDFRLWSAQHGAKGVLREAVTNYEVLRTTQQHSYVSIEPKTGRTHQIRVHFKAINHPVVGDPLYASKREAALGFTRTALHASSLELELPGIGPLLLEAPLPLDFTLALAEFAKEEAL